MSVEKTFPPAFLEAIERLKKIVKYSHLPGQKHLDLTLAQASQRQQLTEDLKLIKLSIETGVCSQEESDHLLGLL